MPRPLKSARPGFKPGNIPHNKGRKSALQQLRTPYARTTIRLSKSVQQRVDSGRCKGVIAGQTHVGQSDRVLRPKKGPLCKTEEYALQAGDER